MIEVRRTSLLCAALLLCGVASVTAQQPVYVIEAGHYVTPGGELEAGAVVVIRDGRIVQVGGSAPSGSRRLQFPGGVVSPGLIDAAAAIGARGALGDSSRAFDTSLDAANAFNAWHSELSAALHEGVTAFGLMTDGANVIGGRTAVCRNGAGRLEPVVLHSNGPLHLSLTTAPYDLGRPPTSRAGALAMLRSVLAGDHSADSPLGQLKSGRLRGLVSAPLGTDVFVTCDLAKRFDLQLGVMHDAQASDVASLLAEAKMPALVGPLLASQGSRRLRAAGIFEQAGVDVTLVGGLPSASPDGLRVGAALAVRHGLSAAAGRRAITVNPARILGVDGRIGTIERGREADLVVFDGDPLNLASRPIAVFVAGQRVPMSGVHR